MLLWPAIFYQLSPGINKVIVAKMILAKKNPLFLLLVREVSNGSTIVTIL
jgi:hypothetical protein